MSIFGRVRIYVFVLNENWMRVIFSLPKCWIVKHIEVEVAICRPEMLFRSTNSKINNHFVVSAIVWVRTYRMRFQHFQHFTSEWWLIPIGYVELLISKLMDNSTEHNRSISLLWKYIICNGHHCWLAVHLRGSAKIENQQQLNATLLCIDYLV